MKRALWSIVLLASVVGCPKTQPRTADPETPTGPAQGEPLADFDESERTARALKEAEARTERIAKRRKDVKREDAEVLFGRGEEMRGAQNWKDAAEAFTSFVVLYPGEPRAGVAAMNAMQCWFANGEYGVGLDLAEDALDMIEDPIRNARLRRVVGNAYLALPHWGTEAAGELLRGQWAQGKQTHTFRRDRQRAIEHLESARGAFAALPDAEAAERIEVQMDLVQAIAKFTPYDGGWQHWWYGWAESADDDRVEEEGDDENVGRGRGWGWSWWDQLSQVRPRGLEVSTTGEIVFIPRPASYGPDIDDTAKIKFLLHEIASLDTSAEKERAAEAMLVQALLFRARDGAERLQRLGAWWHRGARPYQKDVEGRPLHELGDDQALGLIATHVGIYEVPEDESFAAVTRRLMREHPKTKAADRAGYLLGQFFQSRAQYDKATATYEAHLKTHPEGAWASSSKASISELKRPEVSIVDMGVQPAGRKAKINLRFRNLEKVTVKTRVVDLEKLLVDFKKQYREGRTTKSWQNELPRPSDIGWMLFHDTNGALARYATKAGPSFPLSVTPDPSGRYEDAQLETPLDAAGLYVVEAFIEGTETHVSRGLMLLESIALVDKPTGKGNLMWAVDARTGKPLPNAQVEIFEYWNSWHDNSVTYHSRSTKQATDKDGTTTFQPSQQFVGIARVGKRVTVTGFGYGWGRWSPSRAGDENIAFIQPDRPVYRPGDEVQLKIFARKKRAGVYRPSTETKRIRVRVYDPDSQLLTDKTLDANEFGAADLKVTLGAMARLGPYQVNVEADGSWTRNHQTFRVEEYKAPEFTVSVKSESEARLGEKIPIVVEGTYLFGGPVADGRVRYKVYRADYRHDYVAPARWDWLYGLGYGRCYYIYDWFDWWRWAPAPMVWYPWWGPAPEPVKELVLEGEGRLNGEGKLEILVDTASAEREFGERDHEYSVKAEVTDLSRRLIKGEGSVLVTRAPYFASVDLDRGWYNARTEITALVATQRADQRLFSQKGELVVEKVRYTGDNFASVTEKVVARLPVETREEGPVRITWRAPETGQYVFRFEGKSAGGSVVKASAVAWVAGPEFHGREHRFQKLELRTDQRSYQPGEIIKLMVNTAAENSTVLLATRAEAGRLIDTQVLQIKGRSALVEIPVIAGDTPNFFIEAITVHDGEMITDVREVYVPPTGTEIDISVSADKERYGPGDEVELTVVTKDGQGKPTPAEVALSIFDSAVLYIQPEMVPAIRAHFWAQRRTHHQQGTSNLNVQFQFGDRLSHPDRQASWSLVNAITDLEQNEVDFRQQAQTGNLRGAGRLSRDDAKDSDTLGLDEALGDSIGGLGSGYGGGGKGKAKENGARKRELGASLAKSPARGPAGQAAAEEDRSAADMPSSSSGATAKRVRRSFADTAHFAPTVRTGATGIAKVKFTLPDNLTTWKVKAIALDQSTRAGEFSTTFISTKDLLVRLQAPRFFRERDRVVLSAIVHNKSDKTRKADVELRVSEDLLVPEGDTKKRVDVPAKGEVRVDFWVKVQGEGEAKVRIDAVAGDESDAKELSFPVLVHGLVKTVSTVGSIPMGEGTSEKTIKLEIPAERRPELTKLHLRFSPSLAGGMLDALPYLLEYPYGCTEQTLSRFVPAVLTRKALQQSGGLKLEQLKNATNLNPQELTKDGKEDRARSDHDHGRLSSPVFNTALLNDMIASGVRRLVRMQNGDGGFGWWGSDGSSLYTTAHVVDGLLDARGADVTLPNGMLERGLASLEQQLQARMQRPHAKDWVSNDDAFATWVLSREKRQNAELNKLLFDRRAELSAFGKLLAALTFHNLGDKKHAGTLLQNAEQLRKDDDENETSWLETQTEGWWYWWNNDVETNALYLRALDEIKGDKVGAPRVVKWLLNNRQNGYYWRSTRDTARVIAAFANHMQISGERSPEMDIEIALDGKVLRTVHINKDNMLTFDGEIVLEGAALTTGAHELTLRRKGKGALYASSYLSYFSTEEDVKGAGLEIKVERNYFKLVRDDRVHKVQGDRGQTVKNRQVAYRKVPLLSGAKLESGDLVLVELLLESKNDYTFLAFEDPKPAGMEPVALRSGTTYGEAIANMELRDKGVTFFLRRLDRGKRVISYRLRAEIPGEFHAMPTFGYGMYATELRATSDEWRVAIVDGE